MRLGKLPARDDPRTLRLSKYVVSLPVPTKIFGFGGLYEDWLMLGNDKYGDCVFAGASHETMLWNKLRGGVDVPMSDKTTLEDYSEVTGFDPKNPSTDNGAYMIDALKYRKATGVRDANEGRHKIAAFLQLDTGNFAQAIQACYVFGAIGIGFEVPDTIWDQWDNGEYFDVVDPNAQIIGGHYVCLHEDTKIPLLDGRDVAIGELAATAEDQWVYSMNADGRIIPALATQIRQTGSRKQLVRVHLDDDTWFDCTEDHPVMRRDGSFAMASHLVSGDSLMPLYRRLSDGSFHGMKGYEEVLEPDSGEWTFTHWIVTEALIGRRFGVIHHIDFDKRNNAPENLVRMSWGEHRRLHAREMDALTRYARSEEGRQKSRELMQSSWDDEERRRRHTEHLKTNPKLAAHRRAGFWDREAQSANGKKTGPINIVAAQQPEPQARRAATWKHRFETDPEFRAAVQERARVNGAKSKGARRNHKVVAVERTGYGDVYNLEVPGTHNFAIGPGVFVHNCGVGSRNSAARITIVTWGRRWQMTKAFFSRYTDECYVMLSEEQIRPDGKGIHGLDLEQLNADLAAL